MRDTQLILELQDEQRKLRIAEEKTSRLAAFELRWKGKEIDMLHVDKLHLYETQVLKHLCIVFLASVRLNKSRVRKSGFCFVPISLHR